MINMYSDAAHKLSGCEAIRTYINGGKAVVTLKSPTGVHRTYSFRPVFEDQSRTGDFHVHVRIKEGWTYVGRMRRKFIQFGNNPAFKATDPEVKGAAYILRMMQDTTLKTPMELFHEGVCSRCGRRLTSPKSIETGIGPRCRGAYNVYTR